MCVGAGMDVMELERMSKGFRCVCRSWNTRVCMDARSVMYVGADIYLGDHMSSS